MNNDERRVFYYRAERNPKKKYRLTGRRIKSYGVIAGIPYRDMDDMAPGEIMDYFIYRRNYDDVLHQIQRGD